LPEAKLFEVSQESAMPQNLQRFYELSFLKI